jgi:hypothetical protein
MNSIEFSLEQQDNEASEVAYEEAHRHFVMCDSARLVDNFGVLSFLRHVTPLMNNPQEQHVLTQLLLIAEKYEHVLLKMTPADRVLYEVNKGE